MAPNRFMTDLDFTKTQIAVYWVVILLSVDDLNPIRILCNAIPKLESWHAAVLSTVLLCYVILSEFKQVLYFAVKIFFHSILSIFFSQVEVVGLENIPRFGPVIFTINHANQFIDAVAILCTCQHKISYLMAEASWKRRIIGDIAWAMDVVPVKRAQDEAKKGTGTIEMMPLLEDVEEEEQQQREKQQSSPNDAETTTKQDRILVQGYDTKFLKQLVPKDKIRPPGMAFAFKVIKVISHDQVIVDGAGRPESIELPKATVKDDDKNADGPKHGVPFDILKHVNTAVVFEKVIDRLASGGAVGIFPEGGSHDRTQLLPLKVGISLIAYTALEKDNLLIPIVPVGLNYFRAHRWRGRAVIEYGRPTVIDPSTLSKFKAGGAEKRQVCNGLLEDIERSMKSVIVSAPDYDTLQLLHTARRLWQRKKGVLDVKEKQDLTRRFAQGYQLLLQHPNPPEEWIRMQERIQDYRNQLKDLGIRDYQVPALTEEHMEQELFSIKSEDDAEDGSNDNSYDIADAPEVRRQRANQVLNLLHYSYQILHLLFLILVAAIPFVLINFPVGILAGIYAESRRKRALAKSKVKVKGYDVMLTERVMFCIVAVPTLWIFYFVMLTAFTDWDRPVIFLCIGCLPLFAYMGIVAAEAGMVDWKDLWPLLMRLHPAARKQLATLPATRKALQDDLRAFIKTVGPKYLGDIYNEKEVDWQTLWEKEKEPTLPFGSETKAEDEDKKKEPSDDDKKDQ
mmetsp:Transcript_14129/g.39048  ORF Transcript_14129/g.39048 Transcript_14129/m.39048 type:complete len:736 (-) Transcript_14129:82-2289(-)|eukprot:CAMPEP_0168732920 /NCGR_PEP_ID=MMETSP0724-20121128/8015_1 /TAXON_ID=265536 /ORGANISM="Amphiprora sp., Strain CCMP467" /LENGTH=735 /DNA_ID=CAMNT_0008779945 /DNA_START=57 /DNA_END=2264 /DNA_ORIENTATION=-